MTAAPDLEFALAECRDLRSLVVKYVEIITTTERFALAGAAAFAAFSVSGLTDDLMRARVYISLIPFLILSLAALRCLTFYLVIRAILVYIESVERTILTDPALGVQRNATPVGASTLRRATESVSGGFWALAALAALLFWLILNDFL